MNQRKYQQGNERKMGCNKNQTNFCSLCHVCFCRLERTHKTVLILSFLTTVPVSNGPFERNIHFNKEQENYSSQWKNAVEEELKSLLILQGTLESIPPLAVRVKNAFVIIGCVVGSLIKLQVKLFRHYQRLQKVVIAMLKLLIMEHQTASNSK